MKKFRMPTAYTILFILLILVAAATWFVPAGAYERAGEDEIPVAGTYRQVEQQPQGPGDVILASFQGFYDAVDVALFILMVGGFLGVVMKTGAIDAGVSNVIRILGGREIWLIPVLMILFSLGDGLLPRLLMLVVFDAAAIWYVMAYARKVRAHPEKSLVAGISRRTEARKGGDVPNLNTRRKVTLALFAVVFLVMIYAVIPFDEIGIPIPTLGWWFPELSGLFLAGGIIIGLAYGLKEEELVDSFVAGAADLIGVGLIIGISRGITVLMDGGQITDTVLFWGEQALEGTGSVAFILLVYLIYIPLSVLIPSSSGLATLSIPILAPLGQFAGIGGELIVTAFQSASGLVNIITPTAAVVMGGLALGDVPYDRWVRFVWKLILIFFLLTVGFLAVSAIL